MTATHTELAARILVADDSPDVHEDFRKVLMPAELAAPLHDLEQALFPEDSTPAPLQPQFRIDAAFQGAEAVRLATEALAAGDPYDVAFIDIRMPPGIDGLETISRLVRLDPQLQIVMCTAYSDHTWHDVLRKLGVTDRLLILKKPFQSDEARQLALALSTKRRLDQAAHLQRDDLERLVTQRTEELAQRAALLEREIAEKREALERLAQSNIERGEQAQVLSTLLALSNRLTSVEGVHAAVEHILEVARHIARCRRATLLMPDPDRTTLSVVGTLGTNGCLPRDWSLPIDASRLGMVFSENSTLVLNEAGIVGPLLPAEAGLLAPTPLICRALRSSEHVVGLLVVSQRDGGGPFAARDVAAIDTVANMAASTLHDILARHARDEARDSIVGALAMLVECRDGGTGRHLDRVSAYSLILAEALRGSPIDKGQIDSEYLRNLRLAVPLHDIGKVAIPDRILCKPGRLSADEMIVMREHTTIGERAIRDMIARVPGVSFLTMAAEIAAAHHERYDGTGYPAGLSGEDIPLCARIAALADVYDALSTARPYKPAFPHDDVFQLIRCESGKHFDPAVVAAFVTHEADFRAVAERLSDASEACSSAIAAASSAAARASASS